MLLTSGSDTTPGFAELRVYSHQGFRVLPGVSWIYFSVVIRSWIATLKDGTCISSGRTTSPPKTREYGVACVAVLTVVLQTHKASRSFSSHVFLFLSIIFSSMVQKVLLNASVNPLVGA